MTQLGDLEATTSAMFFFIIFFILVANSAAVVQNNNNDNNNNNSNVYDGLNEVDCVAVNSTTKCRSLIKIKNGHIRDSDANIRFKQGETAIIIARADEISKGFSQKERKKEKILKGLFKRKKKKILTGFFKRKKEKISTGFFRKERKKERKNLDRVPV